MCRVQVFDNLARHFRIFVEVRSSTSTFENRRMVYRRRRPVYRRRRRSVTYTRRRRTTVRRTTSGVSRTGRKRDPCMCPGELTPGTKWALAQLDPFDTRCFGAKIPDSNTMPSLANYDCDVLTVSTTANSTDLTARGFRPHYTMGVVTPVPGTTIDWGLWTTAGRTENRAKRASYVAAIELSRPVAHAVRLSCPLAPTSASGFVHVGLSTEHTVEADQGIRYPTTIAQMSGLSHYRRFTLASLTQAPVTVINKWLDDTAFRYSSSSTGAANALGAQMFQTDYAWATIIIMIEGAPINANALSVEHALLSEGIPDKSGVIIGTQAAPNSPGILGAVSTMQSETDFVHTEAEQSSYISRGVEALSRGAASAGAAVYEQVAIPLLQRVGGAAVNTGLQMAMNAVAGRGGLPGVNANPNRLALMH